MFKSLLKKSLITITSYIFLVTALDRPRGAGGNLGQS